MYERLLGRRIPGLGILTTAVAIILVGAIATNVIGKRFLQRGESILLRVPVFRTIYAPVKQLVVAFSPDNEFGFKRVVLLEDRQGFALGFLTKEFLMERANGPEPMLAVYVPPITCIWGILSSASETAPSFPTSASRRASGSF